MGFTGTKDFLKTKRWTLKQNLPSIVCGLDVDTDERNPAQPEIGDFAPVAHVLADTPEDGAEIRRFVNARDGLILRGGPSRDFAKIRTLPFGTPVFVPGEQSGWPQVDQQGDGAADGYCFAGFLTTRTQ